MLAVGVIGVLVSILAFESEDFDLVFGDGGDGGPTCIPLDFHTRNRPSADGDRRHHPTRREHDADGGAHRHAPRRFNAYFYLRFLDADQVGIARAMKGATVLLMDRDSPAPTGDDVTPPAPSTTSTGQQTPLGPVVTTKRTRFERTPDQRFGEAVTDHAGRVRFYIPRDKLASKAGDKVVETTRLNLDTDQQTTSTRRTPVPEPNPDFYFRVTRPNGTVVDTLGLPSGFFLNFQSRRVGTPSNPLTISLGGSGIGGEGGGGGVLVLDLTVG